MKRQRERPQAVGVERARERLHLLERVAFRRQHDLVQHAAARQDADGARAAAASRRDAARCSAARRAGARADEAGRARQLEQRGATRRTRPARGVEALERRAAVAARNPCAGLTLASTSKPSASRICGRRRAEAVPAGLVDARRRTPRCSRRSRPSDERSSSRSSGGPRLHAKLVRGRQAARRTAASPTGAGARQSGTRRVRRTPPAARADDGVAATG